MSRRAAKDLKAISFVVLLGALLVSGCAHERMQPEKIDLLTVLGKARNGRSLSEQRKAMVENIRAVLQEAAPSADTSAFEDALRVVGTLAREEFVQKGRRNAAISDPYVVTIMTAALDLPPNASVLDVGTGSGYQAAVLAGIAKHVSSIEIVQPLAIAAAKRLHRLGVSNVEVRSGDGFLGWPEHAPFDGIIVAASASEVPPPLLDQLRPGGRLIMPIGQTETSAQLLRFTKTADGSVDRCSLGPALFVPMTGTRTRPFARYGLIDRSIPLCFGSPIVGIF
jgi:protein-L-isoaspartate(D-aspartate) O-methyltransferase